MSQKSSLHLEVESSSFPPFPDISPSETAHSSILVPPPQFPAQLPQSRLFDLTKLESLDMAEGIARLQRLITVLQAAQGSFVATTNLSLWDQLR